MFSGRFVRRMEKKQDQIDLVVVGTVVLPELSLLIRNEETRLGTEINYTAMSEEEFIFRKRKEIHSSLLYLLVQE